MSKTIIMVRGYTTIEQGKKLIKLGISPKTADMYYRTTINGIARTSDKPTIGSIITEWDIPCWSLSALMEVLEYNAYVKMQHDGIAWSLTLNGHDEEFPTHFIFGINYLFDAVYKGVCWLTEHGYIKNK